MPLYEFVCPECESVNSKFQYCDEMTNVGETLEMTCSFCLRNVSATRIISKPHVSLSTDRVLANWAAQDVKIKHAKRKMEQERASGYRRSVQEDPEGYTMKDIEKGRVPD